MSTKSFNYDHPAYLVRVPNVATIPAGGAVVTNAAVAFTTQHAYTATFHVNIAGTSASTNLMIAKLLSGTATTVLGTATLGTSAAGVVVSLALSTAAGGVAMIAGDAIVVLSGADIVGTAGVCVDTQVDNLSAVTA